MRKFIFATFLLWIFNGWAYKLPYDYNPNDTFFNVTKNENGTYNFYLKKFPDIKIYQSKKADLLGFTETGCGENPNMIGAYFLYANDQKFPSETIFLNTKTKELSPIYLMSDCMSPDPNSYMVMIESDVENDPHAVIIQPIFPSQPKVWIVIKRNFNTYFPGFGDYPGNSSKFLKNGDLYLVIKTKDIPSPLDQPVEAPIKTETIPIDYSIFEQKVTKPTCYAIPKDHKLRLCTLEEAKIRSPALKVFLGEK